MNDYLIYKGYQGKVEFSAEDDCFIGKIDGIRAIAGFHGSSVAEIKKAFHEAVDFYLEVCEKQGDTPEKPYSGKFNLRIKPETHAAIAAAAQKSGKSMNLWVSDTLEQAVI